MLFHEFLNCLHTQHLRTTVPLKYECEMQELQTLTVVDINYKSRTS